MAHKNLTPTKVFTYLRDGDNLEKVIFLEKIEGFVELEIGQKIVVRGSVRKITFETKLLISDGECAKHYHATTVAEEEKISF